VEAAAAPTRNRRIGRARECRFDRHAGLPD
jgi:hypothetical protein